MCDYRGKRSLNQVCILSNFQLKDEGIIYLFKRINVPILKQYNI